MFRKTVTGPDGRTWNVGRAWFPRRRKFRRADPFDGFDPGGFFPGLADDLGVIGIILAVIALIVGLLFLVLVLFNVVVIAIELTIVLTLCGAGVFSRVVLRKPWTVFAKSGNARIERQVVGWRASKREIEDVAGALASGLEPARAHR
ncbi:hypothetical protein OJ997_01405 [Solirubrobacter phytolaccae]|uniref:Uncharacterized protein n=1 Tax=Solirubrobacter phytolaccae TaxID=1404360 RepID=A0A9X3N3J3_9ACTN|nr:hypothetical protein [Solirubrobacter phytolaccae]MDA0178934.1 hypothetical protein [Solirubrobacter phytolaccae]